MIFNKKIVNWLTRFKNKFVIFVFSLITFIFTIVIFTNSIEILFEIDIPYAYSLNKFEGSSYLSNSEYSKSEVNLKNSLIQTYGDPKIIKFPSINKRLEILKPVYNKKVFLVRTNKVHHLLDNKGNIVIYLHKSWQTVEDITDISVGENIYLDSDKGWRYVYRIEEINTLAIENKVILPDTEEPQLLVIIEDSENNLSQLIRAKYLTVINSLR